MLKFYKMQGCGNDYIYFDCTKEQIKNPQALSIRLSNRHFGVGADGIILMLPSNRCDVQMRMFNADGSEGKMCGNGIRCLAQLAYRLGYCGRQMEVQTLAGERRVEILNERMVRVDMGLPQEDYTFSQTPLPTLPLWVDGRRLCLQLVNLGNPHCVLFEEDFSLAHKVATSPNFPDGVNVECVGEMVRVWERGSGETLSCGTGACAVVVAGIREGRYRLGEQVVVPMRGGNLSVMYDGTKLQLSGEAELVYCGEVEE